VLDHLLDLITQGKYKMFETFLFIVQMQHSFDCLLKLDVGKMLALGCGNANVDGIKIANC